MDNEIVMTEAEVERIDSTNIVQIFAKFTPTIEHRQKLFEYYDKQQETDDAMKDLTDFPVFAPIARYATNIAAGYFIGKPCKYFSRATHDAKEMTTFSGGRRIFLTDVKKEGVSDEQRAEIGQYTEAYRTILRRNHEDDENMALARDALIHRVAFERVYVVKGLDGTADIRFKNIDPKKCIAIKSTSIEREIVAFICLETFVDPFSNQKVDRYELITKKRHRYYEFPSAVTGNAVPQGIAQAQDGTTSVREYDADESTLNVEKLVGIPIIEYRMPENKGYFEDCIPLLNARDALLNHLRNTFKYNDEAILMLIGYMKPDNDNELEKLHSQIEAFKMLFLDEGSNVAWLMKDVPIDSINGYYNILTQDIFAMLGIKNPCRQSEVYQNITTVRYQNYGMDSTILGMERTFERSLLEGRAQIITKLLNYINDKKWNWELLDVAFERNLPSSRTEEAQFIAQMKSANILADEDILDQVSFVEDTDAAIARKRAQDEANAEIQAKVLLSTANPHKTVDKNDDVNNDRRMDKDDGRLQNGGQKNP